MRISRDIYHGGGAGIEVLVGMIGSGKSTYAARRSARGAIVVCHDDLVRMMHPGGAYDSHHVEMYHEIEDTVVRLAIKLDKRVIIDRTNMTYASRSRWVELANELDIPIVIVLFPMVHMEDHAQRRFDHDPRGKSYYDWLAIARKHHLQIDKSPVSVHDGVDAVIAADLDNKYPIDPMSPQATIIEGRTKPRPRYL